MVQWVLELQGFLVVQGYPLARWVPEVLNLQVDQGHLSSLVDPCIQHHLVVQGYQEVLVDRQILWGLMDLADLLILGFQDFQGFLEDLFAQLVQEIQANRYFQEYLLILEYLDFQMALGHQENP